VVERVEKEDGMHPLYMAYLPPQDYLLVFFFLFFLFPPSLPLSLQQKQLLLESPFTAQLWGPEN